MYMHMHVYVCAAVCLGLEGVSPQALGREGGEVCYGVPFQHGAGVRGAVDQRGGAGAERDRAGRGRGLG